MQQSILETMYRVTIPRPTLSYSSGSNVTTQSDLNGENISFSDEWPKSKSMELINELAISTEDAQTEAAQVLSDLNISGMTLVSSEKAIISSFGNRYGIDSDRDPVGGWYLTYMRTVNGLSCVEDVNMYSSNGNDDSDYSSPVTIESIHVFISDNGIEMFKYSGALEQTAVVSDNVELLSFDKIKKIC